MHHCCWIRAPFALGLAGLLATAVLANLSVEQTATGGETENSASANPAALDATGLEYFEKHVRPLLVTHCYDCHGGDEQDGGFQLDSREGLLRGGDSGPAVVPGEPDASRLLEAVRYENLDLQMPPEGRLPDDQVEVLEAWVEMGVPDPRVDQPLRSSQVPTGMSVEAGREFWSFRPLADPQVPGASDSQWIRTPIDAFVLDRLGEVGATPAPRVDRRTLLRRVTLNLIGLPPTPEETEAFLADKEPGAFGRVVDRLLASPRYGERWGRHWLDVARYADSNGMDENLAYGNAWRYRDYVIGAFNDDHPFDRFLVEQVAGDLLPEADRRTKTATGFLALGAKVLAEPDQEKLLMDIVDEQLDTVGKAFMGMSLGCVRCHDHKFDPIKQSDYYALAAIFKSTRTLADSKTGAIHHWNEHSFADEAELERLEEIDAEIAEKKAAANQYKSQAMSAVRDEAVEDAATYLAAASQFAPNASLREVTAVAEPLGLHPRILHHCRLHLAYHRDDPLWADWHQQVRKGRPAAEIEEHYRSLFSDADHEQAQAALKDTSGFLAVPANPEYALDAEPLAEYHRLQEDARLAESAAPDEPAAMGVGDAEVLVSLPIHIRGSHRNLGEPVRRAFPEVMLRDDASPSLPEDQSGRLQLARWMADPDHPLTARVYVNRVWRWHFGRGLVATTENFGALGDQPSHPELLDWLAGWFIRSGWSTKALHRLILRSNVYQMDSSHPEEEALQQVDPENRWLWKFRLRRLEAEPVRDSILAVSGQLDRTVGGKTIPLRNRQFVFNHTSVDHTDYASRRRAVYLPVVRNHLYTFLEQFDFPDPTMPSGDRSVTVIAPQTLLMMNDDLVIDAAGALAQRAAVAESEEEARVAWLYQRTLTRQPSVEERRRASEFIARVGEQRGAAMAWTVFCQALLSSNEFLFVD